MGSKPNRAARAAPAKVALHVREHQPATLSAQQIAHYKRFDDFLKSLWSDVYPETTSIMHQQVIPAAWECAKTLFELPEGAKVLDIGCGEGIALEVFQAEKLDAVGIALGSDIEVCRKKGLNVMEMDLSFLDFPNGTFDMAWCRHVLEHSVFPYFSLSEIYRVLKPNGYLYVEVPAPDTACRHQDNPNHYSVLGKSMWMSLFARTGFKRVLAHELEFDTGVGVDKYWAFFIAKT